MIEIIVAVLTLLGVIVTNIGSNRKIEHSLETSRYRLQDRGAYKGGKRAQ